MAQYRKKTVVVEAQQWNGHDLSTKLISEFVGVNLEQREGCLIIPTLEGDMRASFRDYIIKGVNGEFYPCKPEIFHKTYELV